MTSKWRHTLKFLMNLNSGPKNSPMCQIWAWSSNYLENNSSFFVFSTQKMTWHTGNKRLLWQHLTTMVIDKIREMSIKGVKLKSESFFSISPGVLELWRKNLRGADSTPLPQVQIGLNNFSWCDFANESKAPGGSHDAGMTWQLHHEPGTVMILLRIDKCSHDAG